MREEEGREVLPMAEAKGVDRLALLEDRRMWRLLLARLHPDVGGDHELFLFARAVEEACGREPLVKKPAHDDNEWRAERSTEPFLQAWRDAMNCWALRNREALKDF
jgi:hypothetical protein